MHDDSTITTPIGLARYAHDFFDSARAVEEQLGKATNFNLVSPVPSMYLIGHSIELALKAYLLQHGLTLSDLRSYKKYGHDLHACQIKANELGLAAIVSFHPAEEGAIELLNNLYSTKQLEYIVTGTKYMPAFGLVESFAIKLIRAVAINVGYTEFNW
jgi:hypothetical protein